MLSKDHAKNEKKPFHFPNLFGGKNIIRHAEGMSKTEEERVLKLMEALRDTKDTRPFDIDLFVKEGFAKCEETIGTADFQKVKKYFGIGYKNVQKTTGKPGEINSLIARLRTIENSMYYIGGMKEVVEAIAGKMLCAPEDMDMLTRAKLVILYYRVFFNHEQFVEDFVNTFDPLKKERVVMYSEVQAMANNNKIIMPEELFGLYEYKISNVSGIYFDAILFEIARSPKREQAELLELGEIGFDKEAGKFYSVNKCMVSPTFAKVRLLKKKLSDPRPYVVMETFANRDLIEDRMDAVALYTLYKMFHLTPWKERGEKITKTFRTLSGSVFVDKEQEYYAVMKNLYVADDIEAQRWMFLFDYLCKREYVMRTEVDGNGNQLEKPKNYNMGAFMGALNFGYFKSYIGTWSTVYQDVSYVDKALSVLEDDEAVQIFCAYNKGLLSEDEVMAKLGITEEYAQENFQQCPEIQSIMQQIREAEEAIKDREEETKEPEACKEQDEPNSVSDVPAEVMEVEELTAFTFEADDGSEFIIKLPHKEYEDAVDFNLLGVSEISDDAPEFAGKSRRVVYMMIESLVRHALSSGYITYPDEIALDVLMNVMVPHNQASVMDYRTGSISGWGLENRAGIPEEFAEGFFNLKNLDIKKVEERLMLLKNNRHAGKSNLAYRENSGLIRLYCYVIENAVACGPKMKAPKRNSSLKPKILLGLIK